MQYSLILYDIIILLQAELEPGQALNRMIIETVDSSFPIPLEQNFGMVGI